MTVGDFIVAFAQTVGLTQSLDSIVGETLQRAIELIYSNDDPNDDVFADALRQCRSAAEVTDLIEAHEEYYTIFMSALMIILEEKTQHMSFTPEQHEIVNQLLDQVELFN